jgi:anti-sigma factor RsiW
MDCTVVREQLARFGGSVDSALEPATLRHIRACPACLDHQSVEMETDDLLSAKLPRLQASPRLKERLRTLASDKLAAQESYRRAGYSRFQRWAIPMAAAALSAAVVWCALRVQNRGNDNALVAEAVNDHLRIISSSHPVEIESGGIHQVKPWFTGRLDFAPRMSFSGDDEFPLLGGSVGYLLDRKAAVFVFKCRLHTITLLVFPNTRLTWPTSRPLRLGAEAGAGSPAGGVDATEQEWRGFNVLAWKRADLGFALVSDVNRADLIKLATRIAEP